MDHYQYRRITQRRDDVSIKSRELSYAKTDYGCEQKLMFMVIQYMVHGAAQQPKDITKEVKRQKRILQSTDKISMSKCITKRETKRTRVQDRNFRNTEREQLV